MDTSVQAGLNWLLHSGVQDDGGAVSAGYQAHQREFTGMSLQAGALFISALLDVGEDDERREAAQRAGAYLMEQTFDLSCDLFAVETQEGKLADLADNGALIEAFTALYLATKETSYVDCAERCGRAIQTRMTRVDGSLFPAYDLNAQTPIENDQEGGIDSGIDQLKISKALRALGDARGHHEFESTVTLMLKWALARHEASMPHNQDADEAMQSLDAYCRFLEGLVPAAAGDIMAGQTLNSGVLNVEAQLLTFGRDLRRSEVVARLLRLRLYADAFGIAELDYGEAEAEAAILAEFQLQSMDPKADGGFAHERRRGRRGPEVDTSATAVALQALSMWEQAEEGAFRRPWQALY